MVDNNDRRRASSSLVDLKEYVEKTTSLKFESHDEQFRRVWDRFVAAEKQVALALSAADKALEKTEQSQQRVNAGQNEFRKALDDYVGKLATKEAMEIVAGNSDSKRNELDRRIQVLEKGGAQSTGKTGVTAILWGMAATILVGTVTGLIVGLIIFVLAHGK